MKIFFWDNVLRDYTSGIMIAIAPNVDEARTAILKECSYVPEEDLAQTPQEFDLSEPRAFVIWGSS